MSQFGLSPPPGSLRPAIRNTTPAALALGRRHEGSQIARSAAEGHTDSREFGAPRRLRLREEQRATAPGILLQMPHRFMAEECARLKIKLAEARRLRHRRRISTKRRRRPAALRRNLRKDHPRGGTTIFSAGRTVPTRPIPRSDPYERRGPSQ